MKNAMESAPTGSKVRSSQTSARASTARIAHAALLYNGERSAADQRFPLTPSSNPGLDHVVDDRHDGRYEQQVEQRAGDPEDELEHDPQDDEQDNQNPQQAGQRPQPLR